MTIAAEFQQTVKNLLAAYEGESNAGAKYAAFAAKADAEGFHGAASLFRAASRAEQIHAANHAKVIVQLGGVVAASLHEQKIGTTLENLKVALDGENYEIDTMYPEFLEEAKKSNATGAVRSMTYAIEAEKTHSRLYGEALKLAQAGEKGSWIYSTRDFYVCGVCGYTSEDPNEHEKCPVCNLKWEKFEVIR
jgi:rubrerythrin